MDVIELPELSADTIAADRTLFVPGEGMSFDISLRGILAAHATIGVGTPGFVDGKLVVAVHSTVASAGFVAVIQEVRDDVKTWIDLDNGLVVAHETHSIFGDKSLHVTTNLGAGTPGSFLMGYSRKGKSLSRIRQQLPPNAYAFDIHSILGALRAWKAEKGGKENFFLLSGRRLWRNSIRVGVRETIKTGMGRFPTIRVDGVAQRVGRRLNDLPKKKARHYSLWLSDDRNRLPLLVLVSTEYGDLRLEMTDYTRPDQGRGAKVPL